MTRPFLSRSRAKTHQHPIGRAAPRDTIDQEPFCSCDSRSIFIAPRHATASSLATASAYVFGMSETPSILAAYANTAVRQVIHLHQFLGASETVIFRSLLIFFHHPAPSRLPVIRLALENALPVLCLDETPNDLPNISRKAIFCQLLPSCYPIFEW
ncbi:hypothetical protein Plhal304r1_c029g0096181 [Plasmopara halstedii]